MADISTPLAKALDRALLKVEGESYATDAAAVAHICIRFHGDEAHRVLSLAAQLAAETVVTATAEEGRGEEA